MFSRALLLLGAFTLSWLSMPSIAEDTESGADISQRIEGGQPARSELQQCHAKLEACEEKLSKTFLAVVIQWPTRQHDVDLHIIDAAGAEFFYSEPRQPTRPGELSADTTTGPGVEIWEVTEAPPGEYRVLYNLYAHNDNPEDAIVKGGAYHRDGHDAFRERRLAREGRDNALLVAIITVGDDGNVEIEER